MDTVRRNVVLYEKVKEEISDRIMNGRVGEDGDIGSERELAAELGVSRITIRKALSDLQESGLVQSVPGKGTFACIKKKGVVHHMISLISHYDVYTDAFCAEVLSGIQQEAHRLGFHVVSGRLGDDQHSKEMAERLIEKPATDGYILFGRMPESVIRSVQAQNRSVVMVDHCLSDESLPAVVSDNVAGAYDITQYLLEAGHKKIVFLTSSELGMDSTSFARRQTGWETAMAGAGIAPTPELVWDWNYERWPDGADVIKKLKSIKPTAIFCSNDYCAVHLMKLLDEIKWAVPGDISVVGFDETPLARFASLTTVSVPKKEMGSIAVKRLINQMNGTDFGPTITVLPVKLIKRKSASRPRKNEKLLADRNKDTAED